MKNNDDESKRKNQTAFFTWDIHDGDFFLDRVLIAFFNYVNASNVN